MSLILRTLSLNYEDHIRIESKKGSKLETSIKIIGHDRDNFLKSINVYINKSVQIIDSLYLSIFTYYVFKNTKKNLLALSCTLMLFIAIHTLGVIQ